VVKLKIQVSTRTTIDGETSVDYSSKLEMPPSADFDVYVDNGGLVISALNEVADAKKKTKRDILVEIVLDRALSEKIVEAIKNLPTLPK
jgi:hypothetical protein